MCSENQVKERGKESNFKKKLRERELSIYRK